LNVESILSNLDLTDVVSYREITSGADSSVWKVAAENKAAYALRILPKHRHHQFMQELNFINLAISRGIPVPKVHSVKICGEWSVMLMQWAVGKTIMEELEDHPQRALQLGMEYGKVQARIHAISNSVLDETNNWLTPGTEEELNLYRRAAASVDFKQNALLHLDYHPLNVLTDGHKVTAVIDWTNAAHGDPRFDIARTMSILELETAHFEEISPAIEDFKIGCLNGYQQISGPILDLSIFNAWAGIRMLRDLAGKRSEEDFRKIRHWTQRQLSGCEAL
jgi:aminoglycoside phosphotransferase (APT) family kinase protein